MSSSSPILVAVATRICPGPPSPALKSQMLSGPSLTFYIGPSRNYYRISKSLVAYYSDKFFDKYTRDKNGAIALPGISIEHFDAYVLLIHNGAYTTLLNPVNPGADVDAIMSVLAVAKQFNVGDMTAILQRPLGAAITASLTFSKALRSDQEKGLRLEENLWMVTKGYIDTVFKCTGKGSGLRTTVVRAVLADHGLAGLKESKALLKMGSEFFEEAFLVVVQFGVSDQHWKTWVENL